LGLYAGDQDISDYIMYYIDRCVLSSVAWKANCYECVWLIQSGPK